MASMALRSALAGSLFGMGLTYAAVYPPRVIVDQLLLTNLHMFRVFLTATACSTLVVVLLAAANVFVPSPRPPQTLGIFSPYDANIVGGTLIGIGMALGGACPGTVLPQLIIGFPSALPALIGAVLGGLLWALVGSRIRKPTAAKGEAKWTLYDRFEMGRSQTTAAFIAACFVIVLLSTLIDGGRNNLVHGINGGLAIGVAQAGSILLTGNSIGSSTAYEEAGRWILWFAQGSRDSTGSRETRPPYRSLIFSGGALLGSLVLAVATATRAQQDDQSVSVLAAVIGGACLAFGARLAGGCTSGHGISGMATMSVASFVSVAAMFGGGMVAMRFV